MMMAHMEVLSLNRWNAAMARRLGIRFAEFCCRRLPGAAVTSVQIDGVLHEFSTVPGVMEDVTEIILNLKGLSLKIHSDEEKVLGN